MIALLALTLLPGLAAVDALDEREARDLVTAHESTTHREWLSPIYAYEPFFEKPLAGYAPEVLARRLLARVVPGAERAVTVVAVSRLMRALLAAALARAAARGARGRCTGVRDAARLARRRAVDRAAHRPRSRPECIARARLARARR